MRRKIKLYQRRFLRTHAAKIEALKRLHEHPVTIPVTTFVVLGAISTGLFLYVNGGSPKFRPISSYIAIVSHDHMVESVPTREPTVKALLNKLNIKLNTGDMVEPSLDTPITQDFFHVNVYRAVPVEIVNGNQTIFTFSAATTPRAIAQQAGVNVYPDDLVNDEPVVNFAAANSISKQVVINRAVPVALNIYGRPTLIRTHTKTVAQLLANLNVSLGKGDTIKPALNTPITPNLQIFLLRHGTQITSITQTIPMPVQTVRDNSLTFGTSAVRQQGSPGQEVLTYQIVTVNGQATQKKLIQKVVTVPPVAEIVAEGQAVQIPSDKTAVMAEAGIPASDYAYVNYIVSNESGWCPTKLQGEAGYCPGYAPASIPSYLGYGLGQATPGTKMAAYGGDWKTNPVTQLRWATAYADGTYGSWAGAYDHWQADHWW